MLPESKCCTKCGTDKPLSAFSKSPNCKHGVKSTCKACDAARHADQYVPKPRRPRRPPLDESSTKACRKCGAVKALTEFSLSRKATETANAVYRSDCKACCSERTKQWFVDNPGRAAANKRRSVLAAYGLTVEEYESLLRQQGGVCAICRRPERSIRNGKLLRMPVDHDHETGAVRGILCHSCNRAIGFLGEDVAIVQETVAYLLRHQEKQSG